MRKLLLLALAFVLPLSSFAQTAAQTAQTKETASSAVSVMIEYSPIDLLIPSKIGGTIGYAPDGLQAFEAEYLSASYSVPAFIEDIGSFNDKRISFVRRVYASGGAGSFNLHYGLSYFDTTISVGSKFLATATNANVYGELMKEHSLGAIIGIGNRWTPAKGFTLGVDWISYAQPLLVVDQDSSIIDAIQDQTAKKTLQDAFQASLYFPRLSLLKVGIGWTF
jgi:hypothetical protein